VSKLTGPSCDYVNLSKIKKKMFVMTGCEGYLNLRKIIFLKRITWVREILDITGMGGNIRKETDDS